MDSLNIHTVIVGAGVVGMAIARELALRGTEIVVLEAEPTIGSVISARNSGVIHAGLYYAPGSLKARYCVAGRDMLYAYAAERGIWHQRCGKLVVATNPDEIDVLHKLKDNAEKNGVTDLQHLTRAEAQSMEPELSCVAALLSPSSGLIDVHALLEAFAYDATSHGALLQCHSRYLRTEIRNGGGFSVYVEGDDGVSYSIECRELINTGGLEAQKIAGTIEGFDQTLIPEQLLGKGSYFFLEGQKAPFSRLIYPLPIPGSSGLHCRRDINGRCVLGPDFEIVDHIDYRVDPGRTKYFFENVRRYFPKLRAECLVPDYAGIRPKLKQHSDFIVQYEGDHKIPGLVNCFGIESPGVTSCMALGREIVMRLYK